MDIHILMKQHVHIDVDLFQVLTVMTSHECNGTPDSKVHGTNMGPIWGRQDPGGPHVGPMNLPIWDL